VHYDLSQAQLISILQNALIAAHIVLLRLCCSDLNEKQRRMVFIISMFAAGLFLSAVLLIFVTLLLTPSIDERSK
jgi:hypothetical protein